MIRAQQVWLEYCLDAKRDDDLNCWRGDIGTGDFKHFKQALQKGKIPDIQTILDVHDQSPELSCTYGNRYNRIRWHRAQELIIKHSKPGDVIIDIGAGSHASVINSLITKAPDRHYVICDLTTPLLLAYYNIGKKHRVQYINDRDIVQWGDIMKHIKANQCTMIPHHMNDLLYEMPVQSVFYNSYSFSEMSYFELEKYLDIVGTTRSKLISENYWNSGQYVSCHLCQEPVTPIETYIPKTFQTIYSRDPHVPTNPGAKIFVYNT